MKTLGELQEEKTKLQAEVEKVYQTRNDLLIEPTNRLKKILEKAVNKRLFDEAKNIYEITNDSKEGIVVNGVRLLELDEPSFDKYLAILENLSLDYQDRYTLVQEIERLKFRLHQLMPTLENKTAE